MKLDKKIGKEKSVVSKYKKNRIVKLKEKFNARRQ